MQTPEQKAEAIINKYLDYDIESEFQECASAPLYKIGISEKNATECALVAIEFLIDNMHPSLVDENREYWLEVRGHIVEILNKQYGANISY